MTFPTFRVYNSVKIPPLGLFIHSMQKGSCFVCFFFLDSLGIIFHYLDVNLSHVRMTQIAVPVIDKVQMARVRRRGNTAPSNWDRFFVGTRVENGVQGLVTYILSFFHPRHASKHGGRSSVNCSHRRAKLPSRPQFIYTQQCIIVTQTAQHLHTRDGKIFPTDAEKI